MSKLEEDQGGSGGTYTALHNAVITTDVTLVAEFVLDPGGEAKPVRLVAHVIDLSAGTRRLSSASIADHLATPRGDSIGSTSVLDAQMHLVAGANTVALGAVAAYLANTYPPADVQLAMGANTVPLG